MGLYMAKKIAFNIKPLPLSWVNLSYTPPLNQNSKNGDVPKVRLVGICQWYQYECQTTFG